jgi:hypothetical protein
VNPPTSAPQAMWVGGFASTAEVERSLDLREWLDTIRSVDELVAETIAAGLYDLQREQRFVVIDTFDNGLECLERISDWRGTRVPSGVSKRLNAATSRVTVQQEVRLRLLRRRD